MDKFCIITNMEKDEDFLFTHMITDYLRKHNKKYVVAVSENNGCYCEDGYIMPSEIPRDVECAIVLGGDGTMIMAANNMASKDIPIIGVNLGTLGFLTEIDKDKIYESLDALFDDKFKIESRLMIACSQQGIHQGDALNDIVISKKNTSSLIRIKIYINDEVANTYLSDGVIISTPTGSTGYNLSAGGPVVAPYSKVMIITPICPHSLFNRSIIVSWEDEIRIELENRNKKKEEAIISLDGSTKIELQEGDTIRIKKAERKAKFIKIKQKGFFVQLRTKLGGG